MTLALPTHFEETHSARWTTLHLGIGMYVSKESTLGQAAEVAGLTQREFQRELTQRDIPLNYGMEDLQSDLQAVDDLASQ